MSAPMDVLAVRRWVAELSVSANGMHEIREGAVNECERPLVGYAATYEQARGIAASHNDSAAVAELIADVTQIIESLKSRIDADNAMTPQAVMVRRAAASLARCGGAA